MKRVLLCLLLSLSACACAAQRLRCDGPLQPINIAAAAAGTGVRTDSHAPVRP